MTFDEIVGEVEDRLNLRSGTAAARVGRLVNAVYRKVTSSIGLATARPVFGLEATASLGSAVVTFTGIEKIDRVTDETSGSLVVLTEISIDEMRTKEAGTGDPTEYAIQSMGRNSVTIRLNVLAQTAFTLKADGLETASTLSGSQVPAFSESYHDVLVEGVLKDEYLKLEKPTLAKVAKDTYEERLSELRLFIAKGKLKIRPGDRTASESFGSGGGGGSVGGLSYTQTGLITFDRAGTGVAPFAVASDNNGVVANLNVDLLDGLEASAFALIAGTNVFTGVNTFPNSGGLRVLDTDSSHTLWITPASNLTANRLLNIATGDADRTVTLSGNPTLSDWFDQSVKIASSPTFASPTLTGSLAMTAGDDILIENDSADDINAFRVRQSVASKSCAIRAENMDNTAGGRAISGLYTAVPDGAGDTYRGSIHNYGSNYNIAAFRGYTNVSCDRGEGLILRNIHASTANVRIFAGATGGFADEIARFTPAGLLFATDNAVDIGASGATRPRDFFLGRNATVGGLLTLAGGQLAFPAAQAASADANTLDDYEEGTWTPTDASGAGLTFSVGSGTYVKIGQLVMATFSITYPATADATENLIGGLPFTTANVQGQGGFIAQTSEGPGLTPLVVLSSTTFRFRTDPDTVTANSALSSDFIRGTLIYRATA